MVSLASLALLALAPPALALDPHGARYLDDAGELFWFLQLSDTHVGADMIYGTQDTDNLSWTIEAAAEVILPEFIVCTGDLVDATNGYLVPTAQYQEEWDEYNETLADQVVTFFHDIPGNHDTYYDEGATYYLGNTLIGTAYGQWHEAWSHAFPYGEYLFVGLNSADTTGSWAGFDSPGIDEDERAFLEESLDAYPDARLAFVFSHHPAESLEQGGDETQVILQERGVSAWAAGHWHSHAQSFEGETLHLVLDSAGKSEGDNLALFAVDHDGVSLRSFDIGSWPMVQITAPVDAGLGGGNPYAKLVSAQHDANPVRALVFDENTPDAVMFWVDDGEEQAMEEVAPSVWQGSFDATLYEQGVHELTVRSQSLSGSNSHTIEIELGVTECDDGVDNDGNGYADHDEDGGCHGPSDDDESGWGAPVDTGTDDTGPLDSPVDSDPGPSDSQGETGDSPSAADSGDEHGGIVQPKGCDCSTGDGPVLPTAGLLALLPWSVRRRRRS